MILLFVLINIQTIQAQESPVQEVELLNKRGIWTEVEYSAYLYPDYPEIFPLKLRFHSLGSLSEEKQKLANYTDIVFIKEFQISVEAEGFNSINKRNSEDEYIGTDWLELEYAIDREMIGKQDSLLIELRFIPHNDSIYVKNDLYDLSVELKSEVTAEETISDFLRIIFPFLSFLALYVIHERLNKYYLENVNWYETPKYLVKYLKLKYNKFKLRNKFTLFIKYLIWPSYWVMIIIEILIILGGTFYIFIL